MTTTNTRNDWYETYRQLAEKAEENRDSQSVAFGLLVAYDELASDEQAEIHELLTEWLLSDDNKLRYDAGFIASERQIVEMIPAFRRAIEWKGEPSGAEAKYELEKLNRILSELEAMKAKDG